MLLFEVCDLGDVMAEPGMWFVTRGGSFAGPKTRHFVQDSSKYRIFRFPITFYLLHLTLSGARFRAQVKLWHETQCLTHLQ